MVLYKLLTFAAKKYNFEISSLKYIESGKSHIFSFNKNEKGYILRLSKRPVEDIKYFKAEINFLFYLSNNNAGVPMPLNTINGEGVISTQDNRDNYIITAYSMLDGNNLDINNPNELNKKTFFYLGRETGYIHYLSKNFVPNNNNDLRKEFLCDPMFGKNKNSCQIISKYEKEFLNEFNALPKDKASYGLIHYDIHPGNFLIDKNKINIFDFGDSIYGWFALDIGVALYNALMYAYDLCKVNDLNENNLANEIIKNFIKGYLQFSHIDDFWISKIPIFMKFRQIHVFNFCFNDRANYPNYKETRYYIENDIFYKDCDLKTVSNTIKSAKNMN